ncbi:FAD/NAD(P)-binding protein [Acidovorax sp. PRC11]|uniref:FAD/NAD(P)-binding protein n=3 Tax=Bacteria TaxID=2 RepID=UPI002881BE11|nr:FAD/NAD(P)-binding protein [Acidovorax sp. PRC11]MDT0138916.1 FAD/NAD(P)-binding protein [Acidovorax sp. PRC11]
MSNHGDADDVLHVAIVGGGAMGLASAYHLMQRARRLGASLDVHVFDARAGRFGRAAADPAQGPATVAETVGARLLREGGGLTASLIRIVHRASMDLRGRARGDCTCARFFDDCLRDPEATLGDAARALYLPIDWNHPDVPRRLAQVRDDYYYPLISAMFLCDPAGPERTPVQAALEYIRWKDEGHALAAGGFADDASRKWAESLAAHLVARSDRQVAVRIRTGEALLVRVMSDMVEVLQDGASRVFDICVMANAPADAVRVLAFDTATAAFGARLGRILDSVCEHGGEDGPDWDDEGASEDRWDGDLSGGAGRAGAADGPGAAGPDRAAGEPASGTGSVPHDQAWAAFRRSVLDVSVQARSEIRVLNDAFVQGWQEGEGRVPCAAIPPLLFVGGWPYGTAQQEQCMEQAEELCHWLLPE